MAVGDWGEEGTKSRTDPRASRIDTHDVIRYVSRTFRGGIKMMMMSDGAAVWSALPVLYSLESPRRVDSELCHQLLCHLPCRFWISGFVRAHP
jgi:hypothetical protein